jgi:hypothetical protein
MRSQVLLNLPSFDLAPGARRQFCQAQDKIKVVIGGNAIETLDLAAETAMNDHILTIGTLEVAHRFH